MLQWLVGIILGEIICEHIQRLKITVLGANWQLFRLEMIAKCSYFILSTQNIKFYWFVMKIKKFLLPIWWYNRGLFPLGNKYFGVFVLNGLVQVFSIWFEVRNVFRKCHWAHPCWLMFVLFFLHSYFLYSACWTKFFMQYNNAIIHFEVFYYIKSLHSLMGMIRYRFLYPQINLWNELLSNVVFYPTLLCGYLISHVFV